jgi:hypothetical protein
VEKGEMDKKVVTGIVLAMLFIGMLPLAFKVQPVAAAGPVDWWPMFHHDLNHTGYSTSKAPNTNNTIWSYTTDGPVESSPAVADGKVYVGSLDNKTYCLNALTGEHIWTYTTGGWVISSPAVADGKVYVGSWDGKVYAFGPSPVGGIWIPVDKLALLAPYIALASTILAATAATALYVKHRKKKQ